MTQVIEPAAWRSAPWGATQGTSHEIWRLPDGNGGYLARVSIAEIDAAGPFTALPGFRRWLAVIDDGGGLELMIGERAWRGTRGAAIEFDGADPVHATVAAPARVWNVIARHDVAFSATWLAEPGGCSMPPGVVVVHAPIGETTVILSSGKPLEIALDEAPAIIVHLALGANTRPGGGML